MKELLGLGRRFFNRGNEVEKTAAAISNEQFSDAFPDSFDPYHPHTPIEAAMAQAFLTGKMVVSDDFSWEETDKE